MLLLLLICKKRWAAPVPSHPQPPQSAVSPACAKPRQAGVPLVPVAGSISTYTCSSFLLHFCLSPHARTPPIFCPPVGPFFISASPSSLNNPKRLEDPRLVPDPPLFPVHPGPYFPSDLIRPRAWNSTLMLTSLRVTISTYLSLRCGGSGLVLQGSWLGIRDVRPFPPSRCQNWDRNPGPTLKPLFSLTAPRREVEQRTLFGVDLGSQTARIGGIVLYMETRAQGREGLAEVTRCCRHQKPRLPTTPPRVVSCKMGLIMQRLLCGPSALDFVHCNCQRCHSPAGLRA